MSLRRLWPSQPTGGHWPALWRLMFILLVLMVGLRYEVGGDWATYDARVVSATGVTLQDAWASKRGDVLYGLLNWAAANMPLGGVYFVNTVCAALFSWGLVEFCRFQPRPWLALTVAVPYLVMVVAMGYTRQSVAIGFIMLGLIALSERKILRYLMFVALAGAFHKTAVVLMPLAILANNKNRFLSVLLVGLFSGLFYVLLLQEAVDGLESGYLGAQYESSGAAIRVAMNAVPAAFFLMFRSRFVMLPADRQFWTWMSLVALGFIGLLIVSPSSTAVDRMALYWIPLQLLVLSRLPNALGGGDGKNTVWVFAVVGYSAAVQFVWLFFAKTAFAWLPYQFYPWTALWN